MIMIRLIKKNFLRYPVFTWVTSLPFLVGAAIITWATDTSARSSPLIAEWYIVVIAYLVGAVQFVAIEVTRFWLWLIPRTRSMDVPDMAWFRTGHMYLVIFGILLGGAVGTYNELDPFDLPVSLESISYALIFGTPLGMLAYLFAKSFFQMRRRVIALEKALSVERPVLDSESKDAQKNTP